MPSPSESSEASGIALPAELPLLGSSDRSCSTALLRPSPSESSSPSLRPVAVGVAGARVLARLVLGGVAEAVAVGVGRGVLGVGGIEAVLALPAVGQAVAVGVGAARVAAQLRLDRVGDAVVVGVAVVGRGRARRIGDVAALRRALARNVARTGAAASGAPPASGAKPLRGAPTAVAAGAPAAARRTRSRRGGKLLLDVAVPAQGSATRRRAARRG